MFCTFRIHVINALKGDLTRLNAKARCSLSPLFSAPLGFQKSTSHATHQRQDAKISTEPLPTASFQAEERRLKLFLGAGKGEGRHDLEGGMILGPELPEGPPKHAMHTV